MAVLVTAMLANAVAHLVTAGVVLAGWGARLLAACLAAAAVAVMAVAVFRQSCRDGPPECGIADLTAADWVDVVHGVSVGVYQLFTLAAMLTLTIDALRRNSAPPRWLSWVTAAFAAGSVALGAQSVGDHSGMWQRLWLANNLAGCSLSPGTATARERATGGAALTARTARFGWHLRVVRAETVPRSISKLSAGSSASTAQMGASLASSPARPMSPGDNVRRVGGNAATRVG